jgi:hypothetical protein
MKSRWERKMDRRRCGYGTLLLGHREHKTRAHLLLGDQPRDEGMMRDRFAMPDKLMSKKRSSLEAEVLPRRFDGKGDIRGSGLDKGVKRMDHPITRTILPWKAV